LALERRPSYLEYAYIQLGRYQDAQRTVDIIASQYEELPDKKTAADTPELQARHVRGRTIYAVPDRVVYGYFDMLTRLIVESGQWDKVAAIPILIPSRDFAAVKLQWEAKSAAVRKDPGAAQAATGKLLALSQENDLVYDVGMNNGDDTAYYLSLGFRVIAIEANPELVACRMQPSGDVPCRCSRALGRA